MPVLRQKCSCGRAEYEAENNQKIVKSVGQMAFFAGMQVIAEFLYAAAHIACTHNGNIGQPAQGAECLCL